MIASILTTVVIFFGIRFLASLGVKQPALCNAAGAGAVLFFLAGIWTGVAFFGETAAPLAVATSVAVTVSATALPSADIAHLSAAAGSPALATIDAITLSPNLNDAPPGNAVRSGSRFFVRGWAASADKAPFQNLILVIDRRINIDGTAHYGGARPDVSKAYNAPAMTNTGFNGVPVPTAGLRTGPHSLQVGGLSADKRHYILAPVIVTFTVR